MEPIRGLAPPVTWTRGGARVTRGGAHTIRRGRPDWSQGDGSSSTWAELVLDARPLRAGLLRTFGREVPDLTTSGAWTRAYRVDWGMWARGYRGPPRSGSPAPVHAPVAPEAPVWESLPVSRPPGL